MNKKKGQPREKTKPAHRPMPKDPRELALAMFRVADRRVLERLGNKGEKSA